MDYTTLLLVVALAVAQSITRGPLSTPIRPVTEQAATAAAAAPRSITRSSRRKCSRF